MTRISKGTVTATNGSTTVTAWSGDGGVVLSEITAPAGSQVVIEGVANFIASRTSTTEFELVLPHSGTGGTALACAISAMTDTETSIGTLNARTATVLQELSALDANGPGLFYNLIGVTGANDPGPGKMAFNNATPASVTELYLDVLDANDDGRDVSALIDLWKSGTVLIVRSISTTAYAAFQLAAEPTDSTGYRTVAVSALSADGTLASEPVTIEWSIAGTGVEIDAIGNFAGRAAHDGEAAGYVYASTDGDGSTITTSVLFRKNSATSGDWSTALPFQGGKGDTGADNSLSIGTVDSGTTAAATITGTAPSQTLNLTLPKGDKGDIGGGLKGIACRAVAASNADISSALEAGDAIDGVTLASGDFVLLVGQTDAGENGVYVVATSGAAARHADFDTFDEIAGGLFPISEGDTNGGTLWCCTSLAGAGTIGDALTFSEASSSGASFADIDLRRMTTTRIAGAKGMDARMFYPDGVADGYRGNDGIDDSLSSDYVIDLSGGFVSPDEGASVMISQSDGTDVGSFSAAGGFAAARNGVTNEVYANCARVASNTGSIGRLYTVATRVTQAVVWASSDFGFDGTGSASTITIVLRATNGTPANESDGVSLGSWSGADANGLQLTIPCSDTETAYKRWWLQITSGTSGVHLAVAELEFFTPGALANMTVVSEGTAADAAPASVRAAVIVRPIDAITLNTDLTLEVSRDGGTTWASAPLTQRHGLGFDRYCDTDAVDLSSQPSGSDVRARVKTLNGKNVELRGLDLSWAA